MKSHFQYETRLESIAGMARTFLQWFHRNEKWHLPVSFAAFLLGIVVHLHEVADWLEGIVFGLLGLYGLCWIALWTARRWLRIHPRPPRLDTHLHVLDGFAIMPKELQKSIHQSTFRPYRYRAIRIEEPSPGWRSPNLDDIEAFVEFGHKALEEANPLLTKRQRREIYLRWWRCQNQSFMLLERLEHDGGYRIIAVSIVLPLTEVGHRVLREGERKTIDLGSGDVSQTVDDNKYLLIDTWIVCPAYRYKYTGYEFALCLKHLAIFWDPDLNQEMTLLIEPDASSIRTLAKISNFYHTNNTKDGRELYAFHFPYHYANDRLEKRIQAIFANISAYRKNKS